MSSLKKIIKNCSFIVCAIVSQNYSADPCAAERLILANTTSELADCNYQDATCQNKWIAKQTAALNALKQCQNSNNYSSPLSLETYISTGNAYMQNPRIITTAGDGAMQYLPLDINGDGLRDFLQLWNNNGRLGVGRFIANGSGYSAIGTTMDAGATAITYLPAHVNSDLNEDFVQLWNNNGKLGIGIFISNGNTFSCYGQTFSNVGAAAITYLPADINGDKKTDVLQLWNNGGKLGLGMLISNGINYDAKGQTFSNVGAAAITYLPADINGDGYTDVLQLWNNSGKLGLGMLFSNGTSFTPIGQTFAAVGAAAKAFLPADVNGDGKTDFLQIWDNYGKLGVTVFISNGTSYSYFGNTSYSYVGSAALKFLVGDFNNDGKSDLIQLWDNSGTLGMMVFTSDGTGKMNLFWSSSNLGSSSIVFSMAGNMGIDKNCDIINLVR